MEELLLVHQELWRISTTKFCWQEADKILERHNETLEKFIHSEPWAVERWSMAVFCADRTTNRSWDLSAAGTNLPTIGRDQDGSGNWEPETLLSSNEKRV